MKAIEDVSAGCGARGHRLGRRCEGAQKIAQLGQDAMENNLEATTQDMSMPSRAVVIFFETNMLFGDMLDALLEKHPLGNFPTYFACGAEAHCDWWMHTRRDILKQKLLA